MSTCLNFMCSIFVQYFSQKMLFLELDVNVRSFTKRWAIALFGLVIFGAIFPFILAPLVYATGCQGIGGACGAVALVLGIYLRLPLVIGVGLYLAYLTWKRSKTLSLFPWGCLFVICAYLAASPVLFGFGNFWAASFALGLGGFDSLPAFGFLVLGLIGMSCLTGLEIGKSLAIARISTFLLGGFSLIVLLPGAVMRLYFLPMVGPFMLSLALFLIKGIRPAYGIFGQHLPTGLLLAFGVSLFCWIRYERVAGIDLTRD